jgi:hypothetical protein
MPQGAPESDVVFIDYYINDSALWATHRAGVSTCLEGLIRHILSLKTAVGAAPAIVLVVTKESTIAGGKTNCLTNFQGEMQEKLYARLAKHYNLPLVSFGDLLAKAKLPGVLPEDLWYNHYCLGDCRKIINLL